MVGLQECRAVGEREEGPAVEEALLQAGRAGDPEALERLLALHKRSLYALCRGILGHADDAEDATQETFLRALRGLAGFRGDASFRTWLLRIAVNLCLEWKASRRLPSRGYLEGGAQPWDEEPFDRTASTPAFGGYAAPSPEAIALRQIRMQEALSSLLPRHRALILLKVREGWSVAEIAGALRWNEKRVENELAKARRALVEWRRHADEGDER